MHTIEFSFAKHGEIRYISHLDLMRLFMRAMRRAELDLKLSEGFSPHPKLSIKRALKVGAESDHEEAAIVLNTALEAKDLVDRLQRQLPQGITVKSACVCPARSL
jgi:radical SAM-linked protein